jgi:hypothetical protein
MCQSFTPELDRLVTRGATARAETETAQTFLVEVAKATAQGQISPEQAEVMCSMLGLSDIERRSALRQAMQRHRISYYG